jgi:hypothetical protein
MKRRNFFHLLMGMTGLGFSACAESTFSAHSTAQPIQPPSVEPQTPLLRFVSVADTGTGVSNQYAVANAMANHYRANPYPLVVLAGDNIYNNGEIEKINQVFEKPYAPLLSAGVTFRAVLGNHYIRTANGDPQVAYPGFNMDGRYYTFRQGAVQFFALDTNSGADWANQMPWLERQLQASDAPWKVVFGHHQIYGSGHYGMNEATWAQQAKALFKTYGVQLYINGHEHHYERTRSLNGTTYMITGAGAGLRPVGHSAWTAYAVSRLSFASYTVYPNQILIEGIGTDGQVFDRGAIARLA